MPSGLNSTIQQTFGTALTRLKLDAPVLILGHNDADGLSASALMARAFSRRVRPFQVRILGRGENPWSDALRTELCAISVGGLIVTDLGVREGEILPGVETVVIDHHVPMGIPGSATLLSGSEMEPVPTSSLLAYWCASVIAEVDDLLWIAALGIIGDMAERSASRRWRRPASNTASPPCGRPRRCSMHPAGAPRVMPSQPSTFS